MRALIVPQRTPTRVSLTALCWQFEQVETCWLLSLLLLPSVCCWHRWHIVTNRDPCA